MPTISRFRGIVVTMNFREHGPPHFHVRYRGQRASIGINPVELQRGDLPLWVQSLVLRWAELHQAEVLANWDRARSARPLAAIEPLD